MFRKILIANRGEIAVRIIRVCKELGVKTVAVYSTADRDSLHVRLADEAICIGPPKSQDSYLNISAIISAAEVVDADAIHPGYGFMAENPAFAEVCESCGISFIGPSSTVMRLMGNKILAKAQMEKAKVPVLPWSKRAVKDEKEALEVARNIGFPLIIKAASGGGGRGMKLVYSQASLASAFHTAKGEAMAAFGDGEVYIERYCKSPRHIEVQLMADAKGNVIHLGERDCSIQRRHQKVLEEAPSPALNERLRENMGETAIRVAKAIGYTGVGTIEFLMDKDGRYYFMEMNTRIQVEHPVTEIVTGIDIVREQIRLASGERLRFKQKHIRLKGHSIECRINAEDPDTFTPSPGRISRLHFPGGPGVRVDSAIYCDYTIPPYYDSLLAKLIVYGDTRGEAIARMTRALEEFVVDGVKTNVPLHLKIMRDHDFIAGRVDVDFLSRFS